MDGGVRAGGAVPVAVEVEAVAVEAEPLDLGGEEVEELVPLLEVGEARLVADDLGADQLPEVGLGDAELGGAERCQVAEDADEQAGVDELRQEVRGLGQQDLADRLGHLRVLGERLGTDVDVVDEVLDREPGGDVVLVEDDDGVLPVRREDGAVLVEEVQQRREQGGEEVAQPVAGGEAGAGDEFGGEGAAVAVGVDQGGEGTGALPGSRWPASGSRQMAPSNSLYW